jgi:predicted permease
MYAQLIPIIVPVLLSAAIGYGWARLRAPFDRDFVTRAIMNIGAPCLVLQGIAGLRTESAGFGRMVMLAALGHGLCAVSGAIAFRALRLPLRSYLPVVVFSNAGNLGLPLCLFAFGQEGLGLAVGYYLVGSVSQFVFGPLVQGQKSAWHTVRETPMIYAALLGVALLMTDTLLPRWIANTVNLLAGMAIPLMLLALGHSLASITVERVQVSLSLAAARLGLGFAVGWGLSEAFGLSGTVRGVFLIESAMPVAVFSYLLAARYGRHPQDVAGAVLISTLASFVTLPALVLFAMSG